MKVGFIVLTKILVRELATCQLMWPEFDCWTRHHMWLEFVAGSNSRPCLNVFSPGSPLFLPPQNVNNFRFQFNQETVDKRHFVEINTTANSGLYHLGNFI